jgi:hypothetical protein
MAFALALHFLDGVHIHSCGNGCWRFRPYGDSLFSDAGMPAQQKVSKNARPWRTAFAPASR